MSIYDRDLLTGRSRIETAIERIRYYCAGKKTLVAFSGGKDSQCCYQLCIDAGIDFDSQYSLTRFEPPELIDFIRNNYPDVMFRRAYKMSLVEQIRENGLPNRWFRWCCEAKHKKTPGYDIAVIVVRAAESPRRQSNWRTFGRKVDGSWYCCPIFEWSDSDVWEYLNSKQLPHCSLYDEGFRRIGCVCCPLSPSKMRNDAKRWPKTAAMLRMGNRLNYEKRKKDGGKSRSGKPYAILEHKTPDAAFEHWMDTGMIMKAETPPQDDHCLFAGTGFSESDNGIEEKKGIEE